MKRIVPFNLFEAEEYQNYQIRGYIIIRGKAGKGGLAPLYLAQVNHISPGKGGNEVELFPDSYYSLTMEDGKHLSYKKMQDTEEFKKECLGITGDALKISDAKTPLHAEATQYENIPALLGALGDKIKGLEKVNWQG